MWRLSLLSIAANEAVLRDKVTLLGAKIKETLCNRPTPKQSEVKENASPRSAQDAFPLRLHKRFYKHMN